MCSVVISMGSGTTAAAFFFFSGVAASKGREILSWHESE
jgi:hypothetical protein